jgi:hypothetical protein
MTKLLIGVLGLALLGLGGLVAALDGFDADPVRAVSVPTATDRTAPAPITAGTTTTTTTAGTTTAGEDVSGPCDEAEHRDDPRCTGPFGDDRRDDADDDADDDRSGSNSGPS